MSLYRLDIAPRPAKLLRDMDFSAPPFPVSRLRRLRRTATLRDMFAETRLTPQNFILPIFVEEDVADRAPIAALPGHFRETERSLPAYIEKIAASGIPAVLLFGVSHKKDATGSDTWRENGLPARMVKIVKDVAPHLVTILDVCFCEYTDHGHCGPIDADGNVQNDASIKNQGKAAIVAAAAGADIIAPSSMMDGQVQAIRAALDGAHFHDTAIMAYAAKYASALYGPFRQAAGCSLKHGDRKSYQMNPPNRLEALREAASDVAEGADILMVKPAHAYLDIIRDVKNTFPHPLAAYHVSGEYAMLKAAVAAGMLDERAATMEILTAIRRAGADQIITYAALDAVGWLKG